MYGASVLVWLSPVGITMVRVTPGKYHRRGSGVLSASSVSIMRAKNRMWTSACGVLTRFRSMRS